MNDARIGQLRSGMSERGVDLVALAPSDNLRYELGFSPIADERACMLLVSERGVSFVVPSLNADQALEHSPGLAAFRWDDADGPLDAIRAALAVHDGAAHGRVAVDPEMRADILITLQSFVPVAEHVSAGELMGALREVKSRDELDLLAASAATADCGMQRGFAACRPGVSELDVAEEIAAGFREAGVDTVTFTIVASGPNGAFPHHHTSARVLQEGDAIVIDIGASRAGYASDLTRMVFVGEPTERYLEVHAVVENAVQAALAAARPGGTAGDVDAAARDVIDAAGYGEHFVHRTGHGLGMSVHEPPWIMRGSDHVLREGTVHSIEPGIYLQGEFGVRLEEIVYLTAEGCERFSALPRDLYVTT